MKNAKREMLALMDAAVWWDSLTPAQRRKVITKDKSMRQPMFAGLVDRMSNSAFDALTRLQQEGIPEFKRIAKC